MIILRQASRALAGTGACPPHAALLTTTLVRHPRLFGRAEYACLYCGCHGVAALASVPLLGAAGAYQYHHDEGTRRSLYFWSRCLPILLHYRW